MHAILYFLKNAFKTLYIAEDIWHHVILKDSVVEQNNNSPLASEIAPGFRLPLVYVGTSAAEVASALLLLLGDQTSDNIRHTPRT